MVEFLTIMTGLFEEVGAHAGQHAQGSRQASRQSNHIVRCRTPESDGLTNDLSLQTTMPLIAALWLAGLVQLAIASRQFCTAQETAISPESCPRHSHHPPDLFCPLWIHCRNRGVVCGSYFWFRIGSCKRPRPGAVSRRVAISCFGSAVSRCRFFYYDPDLRRVNRASDVAITVALVFVASTYAWAALA